MLEMLRCYEQKLQAQSIDMERLQEAYSRTKDELSTCKTMHQHPEALVENLRECEKLLENLKLRHAREKGRIIDELKTTAQSKRTFEKEVQSQLLEIVQLKSETKMQHEKIE